MPIRIVASAPLADVVGLYAATLPMKSISARAAILQAARAENVGFYDGDRLIACALLYQADDGSFELLFACLPEADTYLTPIIRHARLTRARLADTAGIRIRARVRVGHAPGRRLALLCGLAPAGSDGGFEIYEWVSADERIYKGHQPAV